MYKVIIVDDERIIRSGLSCFIDWEAMGFEVVEAFEDGENAIEYLKNHSVDVVLTDIRMARVSGIELAKYIFDNKIATKVVMISGYKDFDYARNAIEYNVVQYILKPVNSRKLVEIFQGLKAEFDEEKAEKIKLEDKITSYQEIMPLLKQQFFVDILSGALSNNDQIKKRTQLLKLPVDFEKEPCWLIEAKIEKYDEFVKEHWAYEKDRLQTALYNFLNIEEGRIYSYSVFNNRKGLDVFVVDCFNNGISEKDIIQMFERISQSIENIIGLKISFQIKGAYSGLYRLGKDHRPIWMNRFAIEENPDDISYEDFDYAVVQDYYKSILSKIDECQCNEINGLLNKFFEDIKELPIHYIHHIVIELMALIVNRYTFAETNASTYVREDSSYRKVVSMGRIQDINNYVKRTVNTLIKERENIRKQGTMNVLESALHYINTNYHKDICREDVSDYVYLNSSYFSRFFKQHTGETFSDYLTNLRMEKAMELVQEGKYKSYVISEKVGYKNSKNFTKVFKKYNGCTPVEYARRYVRKV